MEKIIKKEIKENVVKREIRDNIFGYNAVLEMPHMMLMIDGDSGTGKSLIFQYINNLSFTDKEIVCINIATLEEVKKYNNNNITVDALMMQILKQYKRKLIVIDNADVILGDDVREYIGFDSANQYLIFGRNVDFLWITENNLARIVRDDIHKTMYFDYWLKDLDKSVNKAFINGYK